MSEEPQIEQKSEKQRHTINAFVDLIKSVVAFLSESSLLKLLAGEGRLEGTYRFWGYVLSNASLAIVVLTTVSLLLIPLEQRLVALALVLGIFVLIVFFISLLLVRRDKNKNERETGEVEQRANFDVYLLVVDETNANPISRVRLTSTVVMSDETFTKKDGRAKLTFANTSEIIEIIAEKSGYKTERHPLSIEEKVRGQLITLKMNRGGDYGRSTQSLEIDPIVDQSPSPSSNQSSFDFFAMIHSLTGQYLPLDQLGNSLINLIDDLRWKIKGDFPNALMIDSNFPLPCVYAFDRIVIGDTSAPLFYVPSKGSRGKRPPFFRSPHPISIYCEVSKDERIIRFFWNTELPTLGGCFDTHCLEQQPHIVSRLTEALNKDLQVAKESAV